MELRGKKINFLGDSITQGCGTSGVDKCFVSLIAEKEGAICRNYGIAGTRIAKQLAESDPERDGNYCYRADLMDPDADIIVVFGGTNDFGHGDAPMGSFSDRSYDTFCGAVHTLFTKLIEKYPNSQIVVLTPLHRTNEDNPRGDGGKPCDVATLKEYVEVIRNIAEYYSLPVLDLFATSGMQPRVDVILQKYVPDGLHPNDAGHEILAKKIVSFLKAL